MNIVWVSPPIRGKTGYTLQSKEVIGRIILEGKHKIWNLGGIGEAALIGGKEDYEFKVKGRKVKVPILETSGDMTGKHQINMYINKYKFDLLISLWDSFVIDWTGNLSIPAINWIPIDAPFTYTMYKYVREAFKIVAYSKFGYAELLKWFPPSRVCYIPHGILTDEFKPSTEGRRLRRRAREEIPRDAFFILFSGANYGERKLIPFLMMAFAEFVKRHPDAYLGLFTNPVIAYPRGYDLRGFADQLRIKGKVWFPKIDPILEPWSEEEMAELYSAADVMAHPSMGEGFGLPVAEAQSCGTPVIATDCSSMPELLCEGNSWLIDTIPEFPFAPVWVPTLQVYPVPNMTSLLKCLEGAYEKRDKLKEYGKRAREFIVKNYDWDVVYPKWSSLLNQVEEDRRFLKKVIEGLR